VTEPGLSTEAAARFLEVSQASVRRWSDSGLLPVKRVGRRRARRFAEKDLERFREVGRTTTRGVGRGEDVEAFAVGQVMLHLHDHVLTFYDSDEGRLRLGVPFIRSGLLAGEICFLVCSDDVREFYVEALRSDGGVDIDAAIASGTFVSRPYIGRTAEEAVANWEMLMWSALNRNASVIRVVGDMAHHDPGFDSTQGMLAFEMAYNSLARRFPCVSMCQYDVRNVDGPTIMGAIKSHPDVFDKRLADLLA
jgi:hypothetical protein